jgi:hypothetical protein
MLSTSIHATTNFDCDSFIIAVLRVFRFKTLSAFNSAPCYWQCQVQVIRAAGHAVKILCRNLILQNLALILDRKILNFLPSFTFS